MTTLDNRLSDRYMEVRQRIAQAAKRIGRTPGQIALVAVTKYAEPDQIRDLIQLGHQDFGENRVQQLLQRAAIIDEWLSRQRTLPGVKRSAGRAADEGAVWPDGPGRRTAGGRGAGAPAPGVRWHMIGHLQRNKVRKVLEACRLVHAVDSLRLAEEIQSVAARRDKPTEVLLQVNTSGERTKSGCAVAAAPHLAEQIDTMVQVRLRGVMTMAPLSPHAEDSRRTFSRCRELFEEIRDAGVAVGHFNILSMGMSNDFEVAIEEGSNMVRVGTALFGEPKVIEEEEDEH